jgi:hypothetical protein
MSQAGELNVVNNHPEIPTIFITNSGTAIPIANELEVLGAGAVFTSGASNVITITVSGVTSWSLISSSQTLAIDMGYICSGGATLSLALPAVSPLGAIIEVILSGSFGFTITQGAGQQISLGNQSTTAGVGGSLTSTQQGDSIRMVCKTANLSWLVLSGMGNPTIV